jgi:hypothetical protein
MASMFCSGKINEYEKEMEECPELQLKLPLNSENLCWWNAVNFALFHKERQGLTSSLDALPESEQKILINDLYNFYTGKRKEDIDISRRTIFGQQGSVDFTSDMPQSAEDYLSLLSNILNISNSYIRIPKVDKGLDSYAYLYDIFLSDPLSKLAVTEGQDTVILGFERGNTQGAAQNPFPVKVLQFITLPFLKHSFVFTLDAFTIRKSYGHYEAYVKCENSSKWIHNPISGSSTKPEKGQDVKIFDSPDFLEDESVTNNIVMLFYSRKIENTA